MGKVYKILEIQNIGIKLILGFVGLIMVIAGVYAKVMYSLLLTEKDVGIDWWFVAGGFVLSVSAYQYNRIADAIISKVAPKKNNQNGSNN